MTRPCLVFLVFVSACGGAGYHARNIGAAEGWLELKSPHFLLRTDADERAATRRIDELEAQFAALVEVYRELLPEDAFTPPDDVTLVLAFQSCDPVHELVGVNGGFSTITADFTRRRVVVTCEGRWHASEVFMHELTHVFNGRAIGRSPVWLEEGLASYLETIEVEGDDVVIGRPSTLVKALHGNENIQPTLDKLLAADWSDFHFGMQQETFYLASRNLVSVLLAPGDLHRRFLVYLHLLARGGDRRAAWERAFAGVPADELGERMRLAHTRPALIQRVPHVAAAGASRPSVTRARPGEVHADWVHAQLVSGHHHEHDESTLLDEIADGERFDSGWPDGDFWRAVVLLHQPRYQISRVVALLRAQVAKTPDEERAWVALVATQVRNAPPPLGDVKPAQHVLDAEPDALALGKRATTAVALDTVAWYFALRGLTPVGLGFARRALEREPACAGCKDTLALLLAEAGKLDEAIAAEEEAIHGVADAAPPKDWTARLARYRELKAAGGR